MFLPQCDEALARCEVAQSRSAGYRRRFQPMQSSRGGGPAASRTQIPTEKSQRLKTKGWEDACRLRADGREGGWCRSFRAMPTRREARVDVRERLKGN